MKIYTKTGDEGETGLFSGQRVFKAEPLVEAYGTVDELTAVLGVALAHGLAEPVLLAVRKLQSECFELGADLATPPRSGRSVRRMGEEEVRAMEEEMDVLTRELPELRAFILPGGNLGASYLQLARTVCRRAERAAFLASRSAEVNRWALIFLNRVSDFLFLLSRYQNFLVGEREPEWKPTKEGKREE